MCCFQEIFNVDIECIFTMKWPSEATGTTLSLTLSHTHSLTLSLSTCPTSHLPCMFWDYKRKSENTQRLQPHFKHRVEEYLLWAATTTKKTFSFALRKNSFFFGESDFPNWREIFESIHLGENQSPICWNGGETHCRRKISGLPSLLRDFQRSCFSGLRPQLLFRVPSKVLERLQKQKLSGM